MKTLMLDIRYECRCERRTNILFYGENQSPCPLDQRFISRDSSRAYSIELDFANMTSEVIRCGSELDAALLRNSMQLD